MPNFAYLQIIMKNPHPASQLHADQTNNKLYLYEKTNTTNKLLYDDYYQGDF